MRATWENSDEWDIQTNGTVAWIANLEALHPADVESALMDYPRICGDCTSARTRTCERCFWLPVLLVNDTVEREMKVNADASAPRISQAVDTAGGMGEAIV